MTQRGILKQGGRLAARLLCVALLLAGAPALAGTGPPMLMMGLTNETYHTLHGIWSSLVYRDALQRLGYQVNVQPYPTKRLTAMVESGELDGELHRVSSYSDRHPALVRVEEAHFSSSFSAYALGDLALKPGWSGLKHTDYRVEYRAGVYKAETELTSVVAPARLSVVSSSVLGLRKLLAGRTDLFIDTDTLVAALLASDEFRRSPIRRVALMEHTPGHAFLHGRHRELAARLSAVLTAMKKDGSIERYRLQASAQLQPGNKTFAAP